MIDKARYMPQGHEIDPVGVGPSLLSLMEMNMAEDQQSRYREIVMHGYFTTKGLYYQNALKYVLYRHLPCSRDPVPCYQDYPVA